MDRTDVCPAYLAWGTAWLVHYDDDEHASHLLCIWLCNDAFQPHNLRSVEWDGKEDYQVMRPEHEATFALVHKLFVWRRC